MYVVAIISIIISIVQGLQNSFIFSQDYRVSWTFQKDNVLFTARVNTTGWLGIGLNSRKGMAHALLMVAGVKFNEENAGEPQTYSMQKIGLPSYKVGDSGSEWTFKNASEINGITCVISEKRLREGGDHTIEFHKENPYILIAWGKTDAFKYHGPQHREVRLFPSKDDYLKHVM